MVFVFGDEWIYEYAVFYKHCHLYPNPNAHDHVHFYADSFLYLDADFYAHLDLYLYPHAEPDLYPDTHFDLDFNIHLRADSRLGICYRKPNAFFQWAGKFKLFVGVSTNRRLFNVHHSIEHLCDGWNAWDYCYGRL